MDIKIVENYQCGKCGKIYIDKAIAEKCCKPRYCEICGMEVPVYRIKCDSCLEKSRYEKAQKINIEDYKDEWMYWDGYGYNEGYFNDIEELEEYYEDVEVDLPKYVWACKKMSHRLDADRIIENAYEEAYEGAIDNLKLVEELYEFVAEWNEANKDIVSYFPDYERAVIIRQ